MTCPFCEKEAHLGPCAELLAYTAAAKAGITERAMLRCNACDAPAAWEVPFSTEPEYEYYCAAHMPEKYMGTPFNVDAFVSLDKLAHPHPCPSCGDVTNASLCPACQEWQLATHSFAVLA